MILSTHPEFGGSIILDMHNPPNHHSYRWYKSFPGGLWHCFTHALTAITAIWQETFKQDLRREVQELKVLVGCMEVRDWENWFWKGGHYQSLPSFMDKKKWMSFPYFLFGGDLTGV